MAMQLMGVLRNLNLNLDSSSFTPQIEIVLLCSQPTYKLTGKADEIQKDFDIKDIRFNVCEHSLNQLILDLQDIQKEMNTLKNFSDLTNNIIQEAKKATP